MAVLNFKGKTFVQNHHLAVPYHQLIPKKDKSLTDKVSLNDNLIIHGDNLKALKAILPNYAGRVKCIYIDPPYNTGNERWIYNDNVNSPMMKEWIGKIVDKDDLTRHDKWLCMMMPRLKLLRELLAEDGIIFVSIDNNEVHRLRNLMEEVFQDNYISQFAWKGKSGAEDDEFYRTVNEHIICYAKDKKVFKAGEQLKENEKFPKYDSEKKKYYKTQLARKWGSNSRREDRPNLYYAVKAPNGNKVYPKLPDGKDGCWRWHKKRMEKEIEAGNIEFEKKNGECIVYQKIYAPQKGEAPRTKKFNTWLDDVGSTSNGTDEIKEIFGKSVFNHPKPTTLIKRLLLMANTQDDDIILDSFAGSGTTAHALMDLNEDDGGNRAFILVQCDEFNKQTEKIENICQTITAERIKRVIKGVRNSKNERLKEGLCGTFSYFELGNPIEMESILEGKKLPSYIDLARYVFYTATGEEFDSKKVKEKKHFIGESKEREVYLFYKPDLEYLKSTALTLEVAKSLGPFKKKRRIVFAPSKYLDTDYLLEYRIDYCQLPFEIYRLKE